MKKRGLADPRHEFTVYLLRAPDERYLTELTELALTRDVGVFGALGGRPCLHVSAPVRDPWYGSLDAVLHDAFAVASRYGVVPLYASVPWGHTSAEPLSFVVDAHRRLVVTHSATNCARPCPVHAPSEHPLREWPRLWRADRGIVERLCPTHGVGHPDPDDLRVRNHWAEAVHGCCGCCDPSLYPVRSS